MAYIDVANMATDGNLRERIAACAAMEGITDPHPRQWADDHQWQLAASSEWDEAWQYARETNVEDIGAHQGVINDAMILSAVQAVRKSESPQEE